LGQLIALSLTFQPGYIVLFCYHGSGQLASEKFYLEANSVSIERLIINYINDSRDFLERISAAFLSELVPYAEDGYCRGRNATRLLTPTGTGSPSEE
jgi:hypothetical protein